MSTAQAAAPQAEYAEYSDTIRWIILIAVMLGTLMEVIDTSIVNVSIPQMMGNLGRDVGPDRMGLDGLHHRECDRASADGLAVVHVRQETLPRNFHDDLHGCLVLLWNGPKPEYAGVLPNPPGCGRGRAALHRAGDHDGDFSAAAVGNGAGNLRDRGNGRTDLRPYAGRLDHR